MDSIIKNKKYTKGLESFLKEVVEQGPPEGREGSALQEVYGEFSKGDNKGKLQWSETTDKERLSIWEKSGKVLQEENPELNKKIQSDPNVKSFKAELEKAKKRYNMSGLTKTEKQKARNDVVEYFYKNTTKYDQETKDAIVLTLLSDPSGNIMRSKFLYPYEDLIPESPTLARRFFELFETLTP